MDHKNSKYILVIFLVFCVTIFSSGCTDNAGPSTVSTTGTVSPAISHTTTETKGTSTKAVSTSVSSGVTTTITSNQIASSTCRPDKIIPAVMLAAFMPDVPGYKHNKTYDSPYEEPSKNQAMGFYSNANGSVGVIITDYGCKGVPKVNLSGDDMVHSTYLLKNVAGYPAVIIDNDDDNRTIESIDIDNRFSVVIASIGKSNRQPGIDALNNAFDFKGLASLMSS